MIISSNGLRKGIYGKCVSLWMQKPNLITSVPVTTTNPPTPVIPGNGPTGAGRVNRDTITARMAETTRIIGRREQRADARKTLIGEWRMQVSRYVKYYAVVFNRTCIHTSVLRMLTIRNLQSIRGAFLSSATKRLAILPSETSNELAHIYGKNR